MTWGSCAGCGYEFSSKANMGMKKNLGRMRDIALKKIISKQLADGATEVVEHSKFAREQHTYYT